MRVAIISGIVLVLAEIAGVALLLRWLMGAWPSWLAIVPFVLVAAPLMAFVCAAIVVSSDADDRMERYENGGQPDVDPANAKYPNPRDPSQSLAIATLLAGLTV